MSRTECTALLEAVDATIGISAGADLGRWSNGALQRILPHHVMVCGVGEIAENRLAFKPMLYGPKSAIQAQGDIAKSYVGITGQLLSRCWLQKKPQFMRFKNAAADVAGGARNALAFGVFDIGESELSFATLFGIPGNPGAGHAYALRMIAPHLHVVLRRLHARKKSVPSVAVAPQVRLTQREAEVLRWLRQGQSANDIARTLGRSEFTVKNQMRSIYDKLGARNRAQALHQASRLSLPD